MKEIRRGYYSKRYESPSLNEPKEFNIRLIIRLAGLELNSGLLHMGFMFPYMSAEENPVLPSVDLGDQEAA